MKLYLPGDPMALKGTLAAQILQPFSIFLPIAAAERYQAGGAEILIQKLRSELFAVTVCEAVSAAALQLEIAFTRSRLSLLFFMQGEIGIQQGGRNEAVQKEGRYSLHYCPAGPRFAIAVPPGRIVIFRLDFDAWMFGELAEDYVPLQGLIHSFRMNSPLGRQLQPTAIDPFIHWNIRQILEYAETRSERSLFIHSRSIDLLRYYVHSLRASQGGVPASSAAIATPIKDVACFIERHLDAPLSKEALARTYGISVRSLERHFGVFFQQSIGKFILQRRMAKAKDLLAETTLPLLNIALMVGYSELTNFTRAFKAYYGYLPSQVRK